MAVTLTQTFDVDDADAPVLVLTFLGDGTDLTATAVSESYQNYLRQYYFYTAGIVSDADDAFTFTITDESGATLFTKTTTAATGGVFGTPDDRWKVNEQLYVAISDLANGATATVRCTFA